MARGRKPLPESMKAGSESAAPSCTFDDLPPCAAWLLPDARRMWGELGPSLCDRGLLHDDTLESFEAFCQCYAMWKMACGEVAENGITLTSETGMTRINPAASYANEQQKQLRAWASEFGLTPASRARAGGGVGVTPVDKIVEDFLG